jgi:ribonuclease R
MGKKVKNKDRFAKREAEKYENPIVSREYILEFLKERGRPAALETLQRELEIEDSDDQEALRRRLLAMVRDGQLLKNRRGASGLVGKMQLIKGRVVGHKDGFGFVVPDEGGDDLYLNARQMRLVFPDDEVLVRVSNIDNRGRREGTIAEVVAHHTHELVGRFISESGANFVEPSNQRIVQDILIAPDATMGAVNGQMVIIQILEQPTLQTRALGKVIEILGDHMAPGMEIDIAIRNHEIPHEWPEKVLKEAKKFPTEVSDDIPPERLDLRNLDFVTIDGEDAKDFDDAVYCEKRTNGGWVLYVAIADVAHYVTPKSALDKEALNRGNSVYFPGRVIPMLPEVLSNELCSLKPNVNRMTMVCEMSITQDGKISRYRFCEAVIKSKARLTYTKVYEMIEKGDKTLQQTYAHLLKPLNDLYDVYRILHASRLKRGAIDFDLPETKIIFGEGRKIERIVALERNSAHRLIEECMLCANICAARFLLKNEMGGLYRVHEGPSAEKLIDLRKFLNELGLTLPGKKEPAPRDYAKLLQMIADRPDQHLIQTVLLRSLSQAIYSAENKGHFGLAFDAYTHFTSPIRRYPDLVVHRSIRKILQHKAQSEDIDSTLEHYGEHCSMTERRADDATREAIDWLKCEYMMDKVGEEYDAVITSVTSFGFFVELAEIFIEGLVHISALRNDYYQFDPIKHALLGERTGKRFRIGDPVRVKLTRVDLDKREMDFMLAEDAKDANRDKKSKKKKKNLL